MPIFGTRHFSLKILQTFGPLGSNKMMYHDELVSAEIGQVGTQFDGLGHIGIGDLFYNGNDRHGLREPRRFTKLGIENVGAITTRGVLLDIPALKGVARSRAATRSRSRTSKARSRARRWRFARATSCSCTRAGDLSG